MKKSLSRLVGYFNKTSVCFLTGFLFLFCSNTFAGINDGLVAYYPFSGNANDESGNWNNGTVSGATLITDRNGNADSAYSFDGVDDDIEVPDDDSLDITGEITLAAWIKLDTLDNGKGTRQRQSIISKFLDDYKGLRAYSLHFNDYYHDWAPHKVVFSVSSKSNTFDGGVLVSDITLSENTWYHIAGVFVPDSYMKIYINGIDHTGSFVYGSLPSGIATNDLPVLIGKDYVFDGTLHGKIDEVRIYNLALSESEIQALYEDNQNCTDQDEDGYAMEGGECGEIDCSDNDTTVYPGASELCDGKDNDCDGTIDEGCSDDEDESNISVAICILDTITDILQEIEMCDDDRVCIVVSILSGLLDIIKCAD